ncbi:hypothetical protein SGGBAA2069_c14280 [Streptococcus gallolyticus subsp. gallolyticus ATCC BAA-2069]|nr:hypothetical protein SGGBAA2069_c14280 [Streptococcus gallolyticus subsp. gallolyticus ATCC BAA-2069]
MRNLVTYYLVGDVKGRDALASDLFDLSHIQDFIKEVF